MPKRVFWPVAMLVIGLVLIATRMKLLPTEFWDLWPIILIIVGLGGLLLSDKDEWEGQATSSKKTAKPTAKKVVKKTTRRKK